MKYQMELDVSSCNAVMTISLAKLYRFPYIVILPKTLLLNNIQRVTICTSQ